MSREISICVVGAGGSYTSEIIHGVLQRSPDELPVTSIRLMDVNAASLAIMAGLSERMIRAKGRDITITSGAELEPLLDGADFVITQVRVGGMVARHLDESIPPKHGVVGQETTGPGGMCNALRTIPAMLEIARKVERIAPDAFILNYTNPSGIITEALTKHSGAKVIGLCSGIPGMQAAIGAALKDDYPGLKTYCVGLNHLGFIHKMMSGGRDVTQEAIERLFEVAPDVAGDERLTRLTGAIAIGYLHNYTWRPWAHKNWRPPQRTRAQNIIEIQKELYAEAADPDVTERPKLLDKRGGGGYANVTFDWLHAIHHDTGDELVCSTPNRGCVDGIDAAAVVEIVCRVDASGATPLPVGPIPPAFRGLVQAVKAYESLTVEAAVRKDRRIAMQALFNHPLVGDLDLAEALLDELLAAHGLDYH